MDESLAEEVSVSSLSSTNLVPMTVWNGHGYDTNLMISAPLRCEGWDQESVWLPFPVGRDCYDLLWTAHVDPYGNKITLDYTNTTANEEGSVQYLLNTVTDYDGNQLAFAYDANNYLRQVIATTLEQSGTTTTSLTKTATTSYDTNGCLIMITDAVGLTNTFNYQNDANTGLDTSNPKSFVISDMTTPYGKTYFSYEDDQAGQRKGHSDASTLNHRSITITKSEGFAEKYEFNYRKERVNAGGFNTPVKDLALCPFGIDASFLPISPYGPLDNSPGYGTAQEIAGLNMRNSYHWKVGANTTNLSEATITHWMMNPGGVIVSGLPSVRQEPCFADGSPGPQTWYDYPGKTSPWALADEDANERVALQLMPDGRTSVSQQKYDDISGQLLSRSSTYEDNAGQVQTHTTSFSYATVNNSLDGVTYPASRVQNVVSPAKTVTVDYGDVTKTVGFNGHTLAIQRPASVTVTDGLTTHTATYNDFQQITSSTLPSGAEVAFGYGANHFLSSVSVPGLNDMVFAWLYGRLSSMIDRSGMRFNLDFDNLDRLRSIAKVSTPTGQSFGSATFTYDKLDLVAGTDFMGHGYGATFDALDHKTISVDRNNNTTYFGYCPCGALTDITDPLGNNTSYDLDAGARVTAVTDSSTTGNPVSKSYMYDSVGRVIAAILPTGQVVSNRLNMQGQVLESYVDWQPVGQKHYNDLGQLVSQTDSLGHTLNISYDNFHRVQAATLSANGSSQLLESRTYNGVFLASVADANNHATIYGYDALGRVSRITNALNGVISLAYDATGRLAYRTNELGGVIHYAYDVNGNLATVTDEQNNVTANTYDNNHRLLTTTAGGVTVTLAYDANGNLLQRSAANYAATFGYDALNRLTSLNDASGVSVFTYANFGAFKGALSQETTPFNVSVNYGYDGFHRLQSIAAGNFSTGYGYDSSSRLSTVSSPAGSIGIHYNGLSGQLEHLQFPNNVRSDYTYTDLGQVNFINLYGTTQGTLDQYNYTYDNTGRRQTMGRNGYLSSVTYGYDALGQLTSADGVNNNNAPRLNDSFGYGYDAGGNLTNLVAGVAPDTAQLNLHYSTANRLQSVPEMDGRMIYGTLDQSVGGLQVVFTGAGINVTNTVAPNGDLTFGVVAPLKPAGGAALGSVSATITATDNGGGLISASEFTVANWNAGQRAVTYDPRGNLTQDHQNTYAYDALSQL
ncbi:MAG: hypothetical protein WCS42_18160, partial [Verrucomicrobiota bacterium]